MASARLCARPARGIIVSLDSVAGFSTHSTLGALRQQCTAGDTARYGAVGSQTVAWNFPFAGSQVMAVQTKHQASESVHDDEVPDLWTVKGDSIRLPDGELAPRTLGALRSRYGFAVVDGPYARSCKFPYLRFALSSNDTARRVPDSARVSRVDMTGADTTIRRFCLTHLPVSER